MTLAGLTLLTYERECLIYDLYLKKTNLKQRLSLNQKNVKKRLKLIAPKVMLTELLSNLNFLKSVTVSVIIPISNLEDMELIKGLYAMNAIIGGTDNKIMTHVSGKSLKPKHILLQVKGDSYFCYDLLGALLYKYNPRLLNKQLTFTIDTNDLGIIFLSFNELNIMLSSSRYFDFFGWKNKFGVAFVPVVGSKKMSNIYLSSLNL